MRPIADRANQLEGFLGVLHTMCKAAREADPTSTQSNAVLERMIGQYIRDAEDDGMPPVWTLPPTMVKDFVWPTELLGVESFTTPTSET